MPSFVHSDLMGSRARDALAAVGRHGFKMSKEWEIAEAVYAECIRLRHSPPPVFAGLPTNVKTLDATLHTHARALAEHRDLLTAVDDISAYSQRVMSVELDRLLPDIYDTLVRKFADAASVFTSIEVSALNGYESDAVVAAYMAKKQAVNELYTLEAERVFLASAIGEALVEHNVFIIVEPPDADDDPETLSLWDEFVRDYHANEYQMTPFDKFSTLVSRGVTLSLAGRGQVAARTEAWIASRRGKAAQPFLTMQGEQDRRLSRAQLSLGAQ
jgi:hypothetical protein